jgi:hypothetical protein
VLELFTVEIAAFDHARFQFTKDLRSLGFLLGGRRARGADPAEEKDEDDEREDR